MGKSYNLHIQYSGAASHDVSTLLANKRLHLSGSSYQVQLLLAPMEAVRKRRQELVKQLRSVARACGAEQVRDDVGREKVKEMFKDITTRKMSEKQKGSSGESFQSLRGDLAHLWYWSAEGRCDRA